MTSLRKKILYSKVHNVLIQNSFVLFFQYNNIQSKQWIFLRNEILKLENTDVLVIKNKITYKMFQKTFETFSNTKNSISLEKKNLKKSDFVFKKNKNQNLNFAFLPCKTTDKFSCRLVLLEKLLFLCQGPSLIIAFKSIEQCKAIFQIIEAFKQNLRLPFALHSKKTSCIEKNLKNSFKKNSLFKNAKLISLFTEKNQNLEKCNFFFVGGLVQNKIINHLDLIKLSTLNNSIYSDLIKQCCSPLVQFLVFKNILETKLLKCFKQNNLIAILNIHKKNLISNDLKTK